jgi:hypothetical protein
VTESLLKRDVGGVIRGKPAAKSFRKVFQEEVEAYGAERGELPYRKADDHGGTKRVEIRRSNVRSSLGQCGSRRLR